ncbi:MAG: transcription-repair coupling factor [Flavobacteriales bacterium]|nr:transcription-repair coupling factor [Flavobacteriales bacterium]
MTLRDLIEQYCADDKTLQIIDSLENQDSRIHLIGLVGAAEAVIAASVVRKTHDNHVFILDEKEDAAYFLNDIQTLLGKDKVLFFPKSYKFPYAEEKTDNANVLQRAEVLSKMEKGNRSIIVTYPSAIAENVVTKKLLKKNTLAINVGDNLSIDFINELLNDYGFDRVDFVYEPGQFSIRGGIVDIFSFSHDHPYRVEFFGDDIDSIRSFNPTDQLSIKTFNRISIVPNVQDQLLRESRESFLQFMPNNSTVWIKDYKLTIDRLDKEIQKATASFEKLNTQTEHLKPDELFTTKKLFNQLLGNFPLVEFGSKSYFQSSLEISYNLSPQPSFNKKFDLLIENLNANTSAGFENFIFANNAKQIERLYNIFEDIGGKVKFYPINESMHEGFIDNDLKIACYTDHQIFERYHRFRLKEGFKKNEQALTVKELTQLVPGDYVTHIDHGVGKYEGLEKIDVNGKPQEALRLSYKGGDLLYVSIHSLHRIAKYSGKEGAEPSLHKIGSKTWKATKAKTKKKVKEIAFNLITLYAKRKSQKGFAFAPDNYLQNELEASFIYEDTPDQEKSTIAIKKDMESESPMDRLICGDVGFGKTELAVRAAFKAVCDSKQVAILVPTTILAWQHFKTFSERLEDFPCTVDYINRFKSTKANKETLANLNSGKLDIIIGTHRLLSKETKFKDLGLLIIDEEQKFGVGAKDKLKTFKANVDTLTLTATPIPRTLQFSLMGARDLSIIKTPPPNRQPVQTEIHGLNEEVIRDAISYEVSRGGQVFFVHNRVENIKEVAGMINRLLPDVSVAIGHGQLPGEKLEEVMMAFIEGEYDVLVSTTIIESGLDIPNANTIIINNAQNFGLSDLHQMRGRVGRSNKKAFCHLLTPPMISVSTEAKKRLKAIEQFSDLGSGFNIAMRDLDIRGAGNLLGADQSGFISDIGLETFRKILDEAVHELKQEKFKELFKEEESNLFVKDCQIDTDLEILLPDDYVNQIAERLQLYRELDDVENEEELKIYEESLVDRFGEIPQPTLDLFDTLRLRWKAKEIGFEKLIIKNNKMIGYFISNAQSDYYKSPVFGSIIKYVQLNPKIGQLKERNEKLTMVFDGVDSVNRALETLAPLLSEVSAIN